MIALIPYVKNDTFIRTNNNVIVVASPSGTSQVILDDFSWKYKIENGYIYKRKFNNRTKQYVGDWILVGPVK